MKISGKQCPMQLRGQVCKVRKPLLAVSEMNDAGHDVHLMADSNHYAIHNVTGVVTPIFRDHGVYELDVEVLPFQRQP